MKISMWDRGDDGRRCRQQEVAGININNIQLVSKLEKVLIEEAQSIFETKLATRLFPASQAIKGTKMMNKVNKCPCFCAEGQLCTASQWIHYLTTRLTQSTHGSSHALCPVSCVGMPTHASLFSLLSSIFPPIYSYFLIMQD